MTTACPSLEELAQLWAGDGDASCPPEIATHIEGCAECREFLERRVHGGLESVTSRAADLPGPDMVPRIDGFTIERELGRGATGVVYLARRDTPRRQVALKLLPGGRLAGPRERRQWLREAEAASQVRHPNIVTLHEVVEADDWFMLVLEYIPGGTLADRLAAPLAPGNAARIMGTIARAVHHIHLCGQLHLDLKPSNILLDGEAGAEWEAVIAKVSDFGIARTAESGATDTGGPGPGGTPSYMAPEQITKARKDITAGADIHGLGAILYHMLAGSPPYQGATVLETIDLVQRHEPIPLRRLNPKIPADLETICLKCLAKDRTRRYETADALARDIQRYLNGDPVEAGPPSAVYRLRKFAAQHRAALATAVAFLAVLVVATAISTLTAIRASQAAERERQALVTAQARLGQLEKANDLLASIFLDLDPRVEEKQGKPLRAILSERLDRAAAQLDGRAIGDPVTVAKIQSALASTFFGLGEAEKSRALYAKVRQAWETMLVPDHPDTLQSRTGLGWAYQDAGRFADAVELTEDTLKRCKAKFGPDHPYTLDSRNCLASAYLGTGRTNDAIKLGEDNLRLSNASRGSDSEHSSSTRTILVRAYRIAGRIHEAIMLGEEDLSLSEAMDGADHPTTLAKRHDLAVAYLSAGRTADAIKMHESNLKLMEVKLGPNHLHTLRTQANLGVNYRDAGLPAQGARLMEEALERARGRPDALPLLEWVSLELAVAYDVAGQFARSEPLYRELLERARKQFGAKDPRTARAMASLGRNLLEQEKSAEAEPMLRECLTIREKVQPDEWSTFNAHSLLGASLLGQNKHPEAEPLIVQGYEGLKAREAKIPAPAKPRLAEAGERVVKLYKAWGQPEKVREWRERLGLRASELPWNVFAK